jgi:hypothetical protein
MTVGYAAFWIYLAALCNVAGITALILGLIARFVVRPYDTRFRFGYLLGMFGVVVLVSACASALALYLATQAGAFVSFRVSCLIAPLLGGVVVFIWASGFPLSRIWPRHS